MTPHDTYKEKLELEQRLQKEREESDKSYAEKRIEKIVDAVGWIVISTVVLALLGTILIKLK